MYVRMYKCKLYVSDLSWKADGCTVRVDLVWWRNAFFGERMHSLMEPRTKNAYSPKTLCVILSSWFLILGILLCTILQDFATYQLGALKLSWSFWGILVLGPEVDRNWTRSQSSIESMYGYNPYLPFGLFRFVLCPSSFRQKNCIHSNHIDWQYYMKPLHIHMPFFERFSFRLVVL